MDTFISTDDLVETITIRHLKKADLPALEWEGEFTRYRSIYLAEYLRMQNGSSILWVAEKPEFGIIGQVFIQLTADRKELADGQDRAYLYAFRVRPMYRRSGLGTKMIQVIEEDLINRGFNMVTLNVGKTNHAARRLYNRLGYLVVAHEPGQWSYKDENGEVNRVNEPAWRMEKRLTQVS